MDYDSSTKFISSLAKFLQSLCNGYVEFDNGVQVIGHLYLNVDTGKTIDYVLNEKVCKTDENSVTFISNSFHAQPAEKPKPPGKKSDRDSEKTDLKAEGFENAHQADGQSSNSGALSTARNQNSNSVAGTKRAMSPSKQDTGRTGRVSPRNKKSRTDLDMTNSTHTDSIESSSADALYQHSLSGQETPSFNESYSQNFFTGDENSLGDVQEQRDIKPTFDTDVTFIKEEYAPSSSLHNENQDNGGPGDNSSSYPHSYSNQQFHPGGYASQGSFNSSNQRSSFNPAGDRSMFNSGTTQEEAGDMPHDPSGAFTTQTILNTLRPQPFTSGYLGLGHSEPGSLVCNKCGETFLSNSDLLDHMKVCQSKHILCPECGKAFRRRFNLRVHRRSIHGIGESIVCNKCGSTFRSHLRLNEHMAQCNATMILP